MATKTEKPRAPVRRKAPAAQPGQWTEEQRRQISERAYHLFLERGGQHGYELEDWVKAESEFAAGLKPARPRRTRVAKV